MIISRNSTPIELVKCKMQVQMLVPTPSLAAHPAGPAFRKLPGPVSVLMTVIRSTGLRGLWLGHTGTFIRESGGTAAWFATKEFVASLLVARRLGPAANSPDARTELSHRGKPALLLWESALSGAFAGAAFNFSLFPADTVKSAMQTEEELRPLAHGKGLNGQPRPRATFISTFMAMYKAQGLRGLYAGCGITVARAIPSSAIIFLIYDGLCRRFG
jgi:ornithine carrier protein